MMDDATRLACAAVSAASAACVDMIEAVRSEAELGVAVQGAEVTENLADALRHAINLELEVLPEGDRRMILTKLVDGCTLFLDGWA